MRSELRVLTDEELFDAWNGAPLSLTTMLRAVERAVLSRATAPLSAEAVKAMADRMTVDIEKGVRDWMDDPNDERTERDVHLATLTRALSSLSLPVGRAVSASEVEGLMIRVGLVSHNAHFCPVSAVEQGAPISDKVMFLASHINAALGLRASGGGEKPPLGFAPDSVHRAPEYAGEPVPFTRQEAERQIATLREELTRVRPFHDAYQRVCQTLGIEKNILGFVATLRERAEKAEENARVALLQRNHWQERAERAEKYAIALQRAIEYAARGENVPPTIAAECPHHANLLNVKLRSSVAEQVRAGAREALTKWAAQWLEGTEVSVMICTMQDDAMRFRDHEYPAASSAGETGTEGDAKDDAEWDAVFANADPAKLAAWEARIRKEIADGKATPMWYEDHEEITKAIAALREQVAELAGMVCVLAALEPPSGTVSQSAGALSRRIRGAE